MIGCLTRAFPLQLARKLNPGSAKTNFGDSGVRNHCKKAAPATSRYHRDAVAPPTVASFAAAPAHHAGDGDSLPTSTSTADDGEDAGAPGQGDAPPHQKHASGARVTKRQRFDLSESATGGAVMAVARVPASTVPRTAAPPPPQSPLLSPGTLAYQGLSSLSLAAALLAARRAEAGLVSPPPSGGPGPSTGVVSSQQLPQQQHQRGVQFSFGSCAFNVTDTESAQRALTQYFNARRQRIGGILPSFTLMRAAPRADDAMPAPSPITTFV